MAGDAGGRVHDREVPRMVYDDRTGARWRVREVDTRAVPGARADSCLLFEAEGVIRRVWNYPRDWSRLSPEDLAALSWRR